MANELTRIFAAVPDPQKVQDQLNDQFAELMAKSTPTERLGASLANLFGGLSRRLRSGEKGQGLKQRYRTGDPRHGDVVEADRTQTAVNMGVQSAGRIMQDELPEEYDYRIIQNVHDSLMAQEDPDPRMLQEVAASQSTLRIQAQQARQAAEDRTRQQEQEDLVMQDRKRALAQSIQDGTASYLVDTQGRTVLDSVDPNDEGQVAMLQEVARSAPGRFVTMNREEVIQMTGDEAATDAIDLRDGPTERKQFGQTVAAVNAMEAGADIMEAVAELPTLETRASWGSRLVSGFSNLITNGGSIIPTFGTAQELGTVGQVTTQDGRVQGFETVMDRYLQDELGGDWSQKLQQIGITRAELNSIGQMLAYLNARALDPSGRLSDFDVEMSAKMIGDLYTDPQQFSASMMAIVGRTGENAKRGIELYNRTYPGSPLGSLLPAVDAGLSRLRTARDNINERFNTAGGFTFGNAPDQQQTAPPAPSLMERATGAINALTGADVAVPQQTGDQDDEFAGFTLGGQ